MFFSRKNTHAPRASEKKAAERSQDAAAQSEKQWNTCEPLFIRLYFVFFFHNRFSFSPVQKYCFYFTDSVYHLFFLERT